MGKKDWKERLIKKNTQRNMTRKCDLLCINSYSAAEGRQLFLQNARSQMFDGALNMPLLFLLWKLVYRDTYILRFAAYGQKYCRERACRGKCCGGGKGLLLSEHNKGGFIIKGVSRRRGKLSLIGESER